MIGILGINKKMKGDGPKLPMVLYDYTQLLATLEKKKMALLSTSLEPMFDPMIQITKKYLNLAINCNTVALATFLHPAWRMMLFKLDFPTHVLRINKLIQEKFSRCKMYLNSLHPQTPPVAAQSDVNAKAEDGQLDSNDDQYKFFPPDLQAVAINTEIERYNNGDFPLDKKGDLLGWWKVSLTLMMYKSYQNNSLFLSLI
jgi:hypothetical protein